MTHTETQLKNLNWNELRQLARSKGIRSPKTATRVSLTAQLLGVPEAVLQSPPGTHLFASKLC